jgi:hypothetical protein
MGQISPMPPANIGVNFLYVLAYRRRCGEATAGQKNSERERTLEHGQTFSTFRDVHAVQMCG